MPTYRIEGKIYEASTPEEAYAKHDQSIATQSARGAGAQLPKFVQGGLTFLQGLGFGSADEIMGAAALGQMGQSYAMGGTDVAPSRADYTRARDVVRGATSQFRETNPASAFGLEAAGSLATIPLTMGGSTVPATANILYRGYRALRPSIGQSAIAAAGESEAENLPELLSDVALGTATGTATGAGMLGAGKVLSATGGAIGRRLPGKVGEEFELNPARERLALALSRDLEARQLLEGRAPTIFDPIDLAETRLREFGPNAPLAVVGRSATSELGQLRNQPGVAETLAREESRRIAAQRGPEIVESAEQILGAQGIPFRATVQEYATKAKEKSAPFYSQLQDMDFVVDADLAKLIARAKSAWPEAERLAQISGMPMSLDLATIRAGDRVPFSVLDNLKRTLYDMEDAAKGEFGKPSNLSRSYTNLRRDLTTKLDDLSPKDRSGESIYKKARSLFEGEIELENAMRFGRNALREDAEELKEIVDDLDPSRLEAFRLGVAQAIRDLAGSQAGQTRLLNTYKEPGLQEKLRLVFGNDFAKFQKTILQQEELKDVERAGVGSQSFKLFAGAEDQAQMMDMLEAAQAVQQGGIPLTRRLAQSFSNLRFPEVSRNKLAQLLLLRDQPALDELQNMRAYMERRRMQQQLAGQLAGRTSATLQAPQE